MNQSERLTRWSKWWKVTPLLAVIIGVGCNTKGNENRDSADSTPIAPTPGPQPSFQSTTSLPTSPPPISGGTLTVGPDGRTVVAADPDRDKIYVVDVPSHTVKYSIALAAGSEPGRVAFDTKGHAYVATRRGGTIATVDLATGAMSERPVCAAPRGLAYDADIDTLHVACNDGFLASIPLAGGDIRHIELDRDLRDVIVSKDKIYVSRFRAGDIIILSRDGQVKGKSITRGGNLGWRMAKPPTPPPKPSDDPSQQADDTADDPALVSQDPANPTPTPGGVGYYGSGSSDACAAPTITPTRLDIPGREKIVIPPAVLPVDLATNGREYVIVAAGNGHTPELPQIFTHMAKADPYASSSSSSGYYSSSSSGGYYPGSSFVTNPDCVALQKGFIPGQAIAAAFDGQDELLVQSREPAKIFIMSPDRQRVANEIDLGGDSREDTGHAIFHSNSGGFLACASCHAEGGEDGRTWTFLEGERRTPSMRGTIKGSAPYHWDGSQKDINHLVDFVFSTRMSGPRVDKPKVAALQNWLFNMPAPPKLARKDEAAIARGQSLFTGRGCGGCHSGDRLTNNETRDVGTGAAFQVPSLVGIGWRAPYLHNGCAATLKDRFGTCGGDKHGDTAGMTAAEISDLSSYLETF